jgi:hypothetical protein
VGVSDPGALRGAALELREQEVCPAGLATHVSPNEGRREYTEGVTAEGGMIRGAERRGERNGGEGAVVMMFGCSNSCKFAKELIGGPIGEGACVMQQAEARTETRNHRYEAYFRRYDDH